MLIRFQDCTPSEQRLIRKLQRSPKTWARHSYDVDLVKVYAYLQQRRYVPVRVAGKRNVVR
jgi:hypothetical protein